MKELREKFFKECVDNFEGQSPKVNLTPHNMFEWIKNNIYKKTKYIKGEECLGCKKRPFSNDYCDKCIYISVNI